MPIDKEEALKWFRKGFNKSAEGFNGEYMANPAEKQETIEKMFKSEWNEN